MAQANNDLVKKARESLDIMNYQQAARLLTQAIAEAPEKAEIRVDLAFAFFQSGKTEEALEVLEHELVLFPDSYNALILLGYICFLQGDYERAADICQDFDSALFRRVRDGVRLDAGKRRAFPPLAPMERQEFSEHYRSQLKKIQGDHPNFGLPYFILGIHEKTKGDPGRAKKEFRFALERGYNPVECYSQLIDIELTRKDWKEALQRSAEAEELLGPRAEFGCLRGYSHFQLGETENAVSCFERALEMKPYLVEAIRNLAKIHIFQGEFQKAVPLLRKTLKLRPYDPEAMSMLDKARVAGRSQKEENRPELTKNIVDTVELEYVYVFEENVDYVFWQVGEFATALVRTNELGVAAAWLRRFLEIYDRSPELNYNLAKIYEQRNDLSEALRYAWRAKELKNDYRDAHDLAGSIFFKMQDFNNSFKSYLRALDLNPNDALSYYNLGCVCFSLGDLGNAEAYWKQAIQFDQEVGKADAEEKSTKDALSVAVTIRVSPISFESHKSLSRLYRQQNRKKEALAELEKALELRPNDADVHYEIGSIYLDLGEKDKAGFFFDKYISLGGEEAKVKKIQESGSSRRWLSTVDRLNNSSIEGNSLHPRSGSIPNYGGQPLMEELIN